MSQFTVSAWEYEGSSYPGIVFDMGNGETGYLFYVSDDEYGGLHFYTSSEENGITFNGCYNDDNIKYMLALILTDYPEIRGSVTEESLDEFLEYVDFSC